MFCHLKSTGGGVELKHSKDIVYFDIGYPSSIEVLKNIKSEDNVYYSVAIAVDKGYLFIPIRDYPEYIAICKAIVQYQQNNDIQKINQYLIDVNIPVESLIKLNQYSGSIVQDGILFTAQIDRESRFVYHAIKSYSKRSVAKDFRELKPKTSIDIIPDVYKTAFNLKSKLTLVPSINLEQIEPNFVHIMRAHINDKISELAVKTPIYIDRLNYEWGVIKSMGFLEYFYIVYDYINYARSMNMMVGAGRGSACGSLVCYLLGITEVDPIKHGLYFERFLNVDRISMPDIDSDFEDRDMIKEYVIKKYGETCTMEISTDKILKSVSAINHAYAAMNHYPPTHITSKIHSDAGVLPAISELYKDEDFTNELSEVDARIMEMALLLEGAKFGTGVHASGFIISTSNISDYVPIALTSVGTGKDAVDTVITNINPNSLEDFNLIKFDILGISKFKLIRDICGMAGIDPINFFDKYCGDLEVPSIYQDGGSLGIFQLTKSYSVQYAKKLKVKTLGDIAFLLSVIRPATLPLIKQVCKYLETGEEQEYHLVETKDICRETHGLLIYQEQVMKLAVEYAGYTLNEADELRSVMGKKKQDKIEHQREKFIKGAICGGANEARASEVFSYVERFAKYGFNKSHAMAYAVLNLKMAILKDRYPMHFYAGFLANEPHDSELLSDLLDEAIDFGFKFAYPSLRVGSIYSSVCKNTVYFGLMNIKGIKESQVKNLARIIQENKVESLQDLFYLLPSSLCTKTLHDKLFACGAYRHFKGCPLHFIRAMQYRIAKGKNKSFKLDYASIIEDYVPPDIMEACMPNKPNVKRIARKLSMCNGEYEGMHKLYVKRAFKNKSSGVSCLLSDGNLDFFASISCVFGGSPYDLNDKIIHCTLEINKNFNGSISRNILELIIE